MQEAGHASLLPRGSGSAEERGRTDITIGVPHWGGVQVGPRRPGRLGGSHGTRPAPQARMRQPHPLEPSPSAPPGVRLGSLPGPRGSALRPFPLSQSPLVSDTRAHSGARDAPPALTLSEDGRVPHWPF